MHVSAPYDDGQVYRQEAYAGSPGAFTLAVVVDTDGHDLSRARFALAELNLIPGVFKINTKVASGLAFNVADGGMGQYDYSFPGCAPACEALEILRVSYWDSVGAFEEGMLLEVTGPGSEDAGQSPLIYDCEGVELIAPMGGPIGGTGSCDGTPYPAGALLLNIVCLLRTPASSSITPYVACDAPVGAGSESVGALKARFR